MTRAGARGALAAPLYATGGMLAQGIARLLYLVVIGRFASEQILAGSSAALTMATMLALLWPTPLAFAASRWLSIEASADKPTAALLRQLRRSTAVSSALLGLLAVPLLLLLGVDPSTAWCGGLVVAGYGAYSVARGALLGVRRELTIFVLDVATGVCAVAALGAVLMLGAESVVLVPIGLGYVAFAAAAFPRSSGSLGDTHWPAIVRFTRWGIVSGFATNGLLLVTMQLTYLLEPTSTSALFAAAFSLGTPVSMLGQAVSQLAVPRFAHIERDASLRAPEVLRFFLAFSALAAAAVGAAMLLAPWYLPLVYGAAFSDAVPMLVWLLVGILVFTIGLIPASLLLAAGRAGAATAGSVGGCVTGVAAMLLLHPVRGVHGILDGFLIGSAVTLAVLTALAARRSPMPPGGPERDPLGRL